MRKANAFKNFLIGGMVGIVMLSTTPAMATTGNHMKVPVAEDGRPKFMIERIDLHNNRIIYSYLDDGQMAVMPTMAGVAWYEMNFYINTINTTRIEDFGFLTRDLGAVITENSFEQWTEVGREGQIVRYDAGGLMQDLGNYDPTGRWMYFVRFDEGAGSTFWHGQVVDYTECIIQYRDLAWNMNLEVHEASCVANSYSANGVVNYVLEADYTEREREEQEEEMDWWRWCMEDPENPECRRCMENPEIPECRRCMEDPMAPECRWWEEGVEDENGGEGGGGENEGVEGNSGGGEGGGDEGNEDVTNGGDDGVGGVANGSGENVTNDNEGTVIDWSVPVDWEDAAQSLGVTLASYQGNEVEILSRAGIRDSMAEDSDVIVPEREGGAVGDDTKGKMGEDNYNDNEKIEVPDLRGDEARKGKIQWWMIPVLGLLAVGVIAWWFLPIVKRRKDEEDDDEK